MRAPSRELRPPEAGATTRTRPTGHPPAGKRWVWKVTDSVLVGTIDNFPPSTSGSPENQCLFWAFDFNAAAVRVAPKNRFLACDGRLVCLGSRSTTRGQSCPIPSVGQRKSTFFDPLTPRDFLLLHEFWFLDLRHGGDCCKMFEIDLYSFLFLILVFAIQNLGTK